MFCDAIQSTIFASRAASNANVKVKWFEGLFTESGAMPKKHNHVGASLFRAEKMSRAYENSRKIGSVLCSINRNREEKRRGKRNLFALPRNSSEKLIKTMLGISLLFNLMRSRDHREHTLERLARQ